ncbi:DUF2637 domain-containing protein [Phaeacidiphilus oryzae]|uniref:DUF2637 domain-containing protein n=1 Tax=Phaeacidiphilus oryzae TaxID=348818 RepID=UPI000562F1CB|nr:DUF2637 domain-containing protein [Phaeacidiphilus oryzae]
MRRNLLPRLDLVLVQAVIAGALSFAHLHDIADAAGQHGWKGWAYPVSVDLLLVAAWRRLRTLRRSGAPARAAWVWFAVALTASLGANVATAGLLDLGHVPALLRIVVAGWPAVAFLGGTLLAHATPAPTVSEPTEHSPQSPAGEQGSVYLDRSPEPAAAPEDGPAELPAPEPEPPAAPVAVPPALVDHARKLTAAHRARTGTELPIEALRSALGVPPAMADAIAAQLT